MNFTLWNRFVICSDNFYVIGERRIINHYISIINETIKNCKILDFLKCPCTENDYSNFPTIEFFLQGQLFTIHPKNYLFYESSYCLVLLYPSDGY